jgi:hypothetical protein
MIPTEVAEIADLMVPDGWRDTILEEDVLKAAWRVYNAGFRKVADT